MRVVLYEWSCSGGLCGPDADQILNSQTAIPKVTANGLREKLAAEGRAMLESLAHDAAKDTSLNVTVLIDQAGRVALPEIHVPASVRVCQVHAQSEIDVLARLAAEADWTLIVAPETAGILAARVAAARMAGGRVAAPSARFMAVATDKQATCLALAAAGVPVPAGGTLDPSRPLPQGFFLPAVRKARGSASGDGLEIVNRYEENSRQHDRNTLDLSSLHKTTTPARHSQRVEAFIEGLPIGVSCLCGPLGITLLPAVQQLFSTGVSPDYLGGSLPLTDDLNTRAHELARRALVALIDHSSADPLETCDQNLTSKGSAACGWVGVDMILGAREDGRGDRVLEINPRLTTSFVGLTQLFQMSLVRGILDAASGLDVNLRHSRDPGWRIDFDTAGQMMSMP